ncbi:hypothetical protein NYR97_21560 [Xanthomonas hydrangeae]|uniref:Uncharacterized protein n=1 Tax=Xanthomonas hydrangeae TaxID=2775159 RepID=A0AAU0BCN3_9XANT|nr:hypothetical protein [Xanthomonas hydrangeae]WOB49726.1 hypothetical protein NYR97_21560 [Xanthomonas hydrangeae]
MTFLVGGLVLDARLDCQDAACVCAASVVGTADIGVAEKSLGQMAGESRATAALLSHAAAATCAAGMTRGLSSAVNRAPSAMPGPVLASHPEAAAVAPRPQITDRASQSKTASRSLRWLYAEFRTRARDLLQDARHEVAQDAGEITRGRDDGP